MDRKNFNKARTYQLQNKLLSTYYFLRKRRLYDQIRFFCLFIGYPRSGHSLIAAMLDSHPEAIISQELNVLTHIEKSISKEIVFSKILAQSRLFYQSRAVWNGYTYLIKNQWLGKVKRLSVIGDKKAGVTTSMVGRNKELFGQLERTVNKPLKLIHVIRNPFDIIATIAAKNNILQENHFDELLIKIVNSHFDRLRIVDEIKKESKYSILDIRYEKFVGDVKSSLRSICDFLEIKGNDTYLNDCTKIVFNNVHESRYKLQWKPELLQLIQEQIQKYDFLKDYSF